jgi:ABC-type metal ion transport system substrate-binding protein
MKKFFLSFAVAALVLSFTSCKETPAETTTEEVEVEVMETPATPEVEEVVVDTTGTGETVAEDAIDTTSVE